MNIRLTEKQHKLFKHAAEVEGVSLSSFVRKSLVDAARATIREHHIITVTLEQGDRMMGVLEATHKCNGLYYKEESGEAYVLGLSGVWLRSKGGPLALRHNMAEL